MTDRDREQQHHDSRAGTAAPARLRDLPEDRIVELDVRNDLRSGREPFQRIMAAVRQLEADQVLVLRAIFEPAPLYQVLGRQGLDHWAEQLGPKDWRIWFYRSGEDGADDARPPHSGRSPAAGEGWGKEDDVVVLDVRGLEPPEPLVRTLEALERLAPGQSLMQINVRVPRLLLPRLEERGCDYDIIQEDDDRVRVLIRPPDG